MPVTRPQNRATRRPPPAASAMRGRWKPRWTRSAWWISRRCSHHWPRAKNPAEDPLPWCRGRYNLRVSCLSYEPGASLSAMNTKPVAEFVRHHYRHFNAAALIDAADGYIALLKSGGKMMVTLAGAM